MKLSASSLFFNHNILGVSLPGVMIGTVDKKGRACLSMRSAKFAVACRVWVLLIATIRKNPQNRFPDVMGKIPKPGSPISARFGSQTRQGDAVETSLMRIRPIG